ncbi:MAG: nicotinamide-nucleotide amidohydrolase family protein [Pedobacter sp.]|uniref:CinA family protein n=1 Tax=Pedobacter sp. TaxID=1411316 RepID=UPI002808DC73|nr:nicotinamide-nucleotide amidohydrolase family protein [Pedobacter sp.]MDQ8003521.1 nicotinamide-nucleotide amidohydrolase family protein [Pedobacter sp.]
MNITELTLKELSEYCVREQISIAVAESVTAGYLQFTLSQMPHALNIFNGGITTYNIGQKVKHLGLDFTYGSICNCVSSDIAATMALQVRKLLNSKMGIAITGYASPVPEENIDELHAFMAIAINDKIVHTHKLLTKENSPAEAQKDYVQQVITEVLAYFTKS